MLHRSRILPPALGSVLRSLLLGPAVLLQLFSRQLSLTFLLTFLSRKARFRVRCQLLVVDCWVAQLVAARLLHAAVG